MGALTTGAIKLVINGTMGSAQTWSSGTWLSVTPDSGHPTAGDMNNVATALETIAASWWNSLHAYNTPDVKYVGVTCYYYPLGGTTASLIGEKLHSAPVAGSGSDYLPYDAALVVSVLTAHAGRSAKGRSYCPFTGVALASDHQTDVTHCQNVADAYQAYYNALNAADLSSEGIPDQRVSVASFTKGQVYAVTDVRVDSKIDVQRRRQDKIGASHVVTDHIT